MGFLRSKRFRTSPVLAKRFGGKVQNVALLDFNNATFARSSEASFVDPREGWAFADTGAGAWKSTNEARILPDGAVLIEGSSTNLVTRSEELNHADWSNSAAGVTVTADDREAPDGSYDSDLVVTTAGARRFRRQLLTLADNTNYIASTFVQRSGASAENASLVYQPKDAAAQYLDFASPSSWERQEVSFDSGTGAGTPQIGVGNDGTNTVRLYAWNVQIEAGDFATSPIRTEAASATRASDNMSFAPGTYPSKIAWGKSTWTFYMLDSSANISAGATLYSIFRGPSNSGLTVRGVGGACRIAYLTTAGGPIVDRAVTFDALQEISVTMDFVLGTMTIAGCTTGNGTFNLSTNDSYIVPSTSTLYIGQSSAGGNHANAVILPPRG